FSLFFMTIRRPSHSTLFPYTTLFRSSLRTRLCDADRSHRSGGIARLRRRRWAGCRPRREDTVGVGSRAERSPERSPANRHPRYPDRKSTRLNSSHVEISYAVFCLKKK